MRLFKILLVILAIYFIRRFIQMYRVMKNIQQQQDILRKSQQQSQNTQQNPFTKQKNVIDADFKVMD